MKLVELLVFYEKEYITPLVESAPLSKDKKNEYRFQLYGQIITKLMAEIDSSLPKDQSQSVAIEIEKQPVLEKKLEIFHRLVDSSPEAQKAVTHFFEVTILDFFNQLKKDRTV